MNEIGKKLEELRKQSGETQDDVAFALGISRQTIYRWEANIRIPNVKQIKKLCDHFNVSSDYFVNNAVAFETAASDQVQEEEITPPTLQEESSVPLKSVDKRSVKLIIGIVICSLIFALSSGLLSVICYFTFEPTPGLKGVLIVEGEWVLYVFAAISVISLAGIIVLSVLKKRKCNRLGTKKLQTIEKKSDTIK